jgi:hypothetical protein
MGNLTSKLNSMEEHMAKNADLKDLEDKANLLLKKVESHRQDMEKNAEACGSFIGHFEKHNQNCQVGSLQDVSVAVGSLTSALMQVAQYCGFISSPNEAESSPTGIGASTMSLAAEKVSIQDILQWERSGCSLAFRIKQRWLARTPPVASLYDMIMLKADAEGLQWIQKLLHSAAQPSYTELGSTLSTVSTGEPFAGHFGAQASRTKGGNLGLKPSNEQYSYQRERMTLPARPLDERLQSSIVPRIVPAGKNYSVPQPPLERPAVLSPHHRLHNQTGGTTFGPVS